MKKENNLKEMDKMMNIKERNILEQITGLTQVNQENMLAFIIFMNVIYLIFFTIVIILAPIEWLLN